VDAATTTDAALGLRVKRGKAVTTEQRVTRLEKQHEDLLREFDEEKERLANQIQQTERRVADVRADLNRELAAREQSQRSFLRRTVTFQSVGTVCFVVGVVLSVLGNAVAC
jgi:uncharacterized protein YlxW (UPF0749 family)